MLSGAAPPLQQQACAAPNLILVRQRHVCQPAPAGRLHHSRRGSAAATGQWRHQRRSTATQASSGGGGGPSDILALDFDGVLCDSELEVSTSAFEACQQHWPQLFATMAPAEQQRVMAGLRQARPRLVKGYEAMAMARLVLEDDSNVQRILADWDALLPATMASWGEKHAVLAAAFESHRAAQMSGNAARWLALNPLYPGVADALADCPYPFYIASSKAAARLVALLRDSLGMDVDADSPRLFASLIPPNEKKVKALRSIMARPAAQGAATLHFVDDRFETMHYIAEQAPDLMGRWQLYLADWGYNTEEERAAAAALPGVRLLSLPDFCELLRWGVVMGVDDGCEPSPEEVAEAVKFECPS